MTIRLSNVAVCYGKKTVLHGIHLFTQPGQVLAVVGPNGSGKSTLVKAIAGQVPFSGSIQFDGALARPRALGYMAQEATAPVGMTVLDVMLLGRLKQLKLRVTPDDLSAVSEALTAIGIAPLVHHPMTELSGGQRQMVYLAQALVSQPSVLLLDEPTSALDIRHQLQVLDWVRRVTLARQLCTVVVLHDLNAAARFADHIALMQAGQLMAVGTPAEVLTVEHMRTVFGVETELLTASQGQSVLFHHDAVDPTAARWIEPQL